MNSLAPILLSTYTRLAHLKVTLDFLAKNDLAKSSHLYILSDGAKPGDEEKVNQIRDYLSTLSGFLEITVIERETNYGRVNNVRPFMHDLLEKFGKLIYLEDDIKTAPGFLTYINRGLTDFEFDEKVVLVSGFTPNNYSGEFNAYFSPRIEGWGAGIWHAKFLEIIQHIPSWGEMKHDKNLLKEIANFGADIKPMLKAEAEEK